MTQIISTGSFNSFIQGCLNFNDRLTKEQENKLFKEAKKGNSDSAQLIAKYHIRYVVCVVHNICDKSSKHYPDALGHGFIGMLKAIKNFDHEYSEEIRFGTFCYSFIKNEVCEYFIRMSNSYNCGGSKSHRKLFFIIPKLKKDLSSMSQSEAEYIANETNTSIKDVFEVYNKMQRTIHYQHIYDEENEEEFAIEHCVTPESYIEEVEHEHYVNNTIYHGLSLLDERSRDIVTSRWLVEDKKSLLELGNKYNVSQERIRQIESSALLKIKNSVEHVSIF